MADSNNRNSLFYCIQFDRMEFLKFLFQSEEEGNKVAKRNKEMDELLMGEKEGERGFGEEEKVRGKVAKYPWVMECYKCMDQATFQQGNTLLHLASEQGNLDMCLFLLSRLRERHSPFSPLSSMLEFTNRDSQTPLLLAAKYNNLPIVTLLHDEGANLYSTDALMQNVLHYAVLNRNEPMIRFCVAKDDGFRLRREQNIWGRIPLDLEEAAQYMTWLYTIWDAVNGNIPSLVSKYVKDKAYSVNQRRTGDMKTPLHLAVIAGRPDMVKLLVGLGADTGLRDADDKVPSEYVGETAGQNGRMIRRMLQRRMSMMSGGGESPVMKGSIREIKMGVLQERVGEEEEEEDEGKRKGMAESRKRGNENWGEVHITPLTPNSLPATKYDEFSSFA